VRADTGGESAFGRQMKNGPNSGGRSQRRRRRARKNSRWKSATMPATPSRRARSRKKSPVPRLPFVTGHYCSPRRSRVGSLCRRQRAAGYAGLDQSLFTERKLWNVARVCRPRRSAGTGRRPIIAKSYKARTSPSSTTRPPTAKASRTRQEALNKAGFTEQDVQSYKGDKDFNASVTPQAHNIDLVYVGATSGIRVAGAQMRDQGSRPS